MGTETRFKSDFITPLMDCYGANKFPQIRVHTIWAKMKNLPDAYYKTLADKIILNHDNYPGMSHLMAVCHEVLNDFASKEADRLRRETNCFRCNSNGVIQVGVYAYRCSCRLGEIFYPNFTQYNGELKYQDSESIDASGNITTETGSYVFTSPQKFIGVKNCSFIVKDSV